VVPSWSYSQRKVERTLPGTNTPAYLAQVTKQKVLEHLSASVLKILLKHKKTFFRMAIESLFNDLVIIITP
jgi:hypothetical protein